MLEMVEARKNADKGEQRYDLFSGLLDAAQDELDSGVTLSDEELIGGHLISQSFSILEKWPTRPVRKHVHFPSCWT
jgi:hypothetical protein